MHVASNTPNKFKVLIFGTITAVIVIWLITFVRASGLFGYPPPKALIGSVAVFGVGLTIICGALWVGHVTQVIDLAPGTSKGLWITLIAVILSTTAAVYKGYFAETTAQVPSPPRVQVENLILLKENSKGGIPAQIEIRKNSFYKGKLAPILFVAIFSNLGPNSSNQYDAEITVSLENENTGLAELSRFQKKYVTLDQWERSSNSVPAEGIKSLFPNLKGKVAYAALLTKRKDIGNGIVKLRFSLTDNVTHLTDSKTVPISLM